MGRPKKTAAVEPKPKKTRKKDIKPYQEVQTETNDEPEVAIYTTANRDFVKEGIYSRQVVREGQTIEFTIDWNLLARHVRDAVPK